MLYLITGDNAYGIKKRVRQLKDEFKTTNKEAEITQVDASDIDLSKLNGLLSNESLFSGATMVVLTNPDDNKDIAERLADIAKKLPDTTDLVVVSAKPDKRTRWYKSLSKTAKHENIGELSESSLIKWAVERAKELKAELAPAQARLLINRTGRDQTRLDNEIAKLAAHDKKISQESIELLVDKTPEETIFDLLDSVIKGRSKRAHNIYKQLSLAGVDAHEFVAMMSWQTHNLVAAKTNKNLAPGRLASKAGMAPFVAQKAQAMSRELSLSQIKRIIESIIKTDMDMKKTRADSEARARLLIDEIGLIVNA